MGILVIFTPRLINDLSIKVQSELTRNIHFLFQEIENEESAILATKLIRQNLLIATGPTSFPQVNYDWRLSMLLLDQPIFEFDKVYLTYLARRIKPQDKTSYLP